MIDVSKHYGKKVLPSLQKKNNTVNRCKHYFLNDNDVALCEQYSLFWLKFVAVEIYWILISQCGIVSIDAKQWFFYTYLV